MPGKKKQVRQVKSRTSKGKITHHETGGEWYGQIMQGFDGHHKDFFGFYTEWHGKPLEGFEWRSDQDPTFILKG